MSLSRLLDELPRLSTIALRWRRRVKSKPDRVRWSEFPGGVRSFPTPGDERRAVHDGHRLTRGGLAGRDFTAKGAELVDFVLRVRVNMRKVAEKHKSDR